MAEVCDKMRPDGVGADIALIYMPQIALLLCAAVAIYANTRAGLLAAVLLIVAYLSLYLLGTAGEVQEAERAEGCATPRFLAPTILGSLALFLTFLASRRRPAQRGTP